MSAWFKATFGRDEPRGFTDARAMFELEGTGDDTVLVSRPNGARFRIGRFDTPSVSELRAMAAEAAGAGGGGGGLRFYNIAADVRSLICDESYAGCVFQVRQR